MVMQEIVILLILLIVVIVLLFMLFSAHNFASVVKAGNVDDFHWSCQVINDDKPETIEYGSKKISTAQLDMVVIRGESMKRYGIHDNYIGFIRVFRKKEKGSIVGMPIVNFKVHENLFAIWESHQKLRKFIAYLPPQKEGYDFREIYNQYKAYIDVEEDVFVKECTERMKKINRTRMFHKDQRLVLSETYDNVKKRNHYSIHRVSSLRGILEYYYNPLEAKEDVA